MRVKTSVPMAPDIVLLRQAEHTTMIADAAPVDLAEAVRRAVIAMQGKWGEKGLAFELELGDTKWYKSTGSLYHFSQSGTNSPWICTTFGSPALLDRAVANLLDNACKFSPAGGTVRATLQVVPPEQREGGASARYVALIVENDGPAIAPEAQAHIFERFYQADKSHATQGAGLGLPLVARVAELHSGSVHVQSTPAASCTSSTATPEGHTTFTLELPL